MTQKATFGAGCFWSVEELFRKVEGVIETKVGYMGGITNNPTYKDVCSGETNHAEVVEITFDENKVSYEKLLDLFWNNHDPTQLNRQGVDVGTQYRSVIFYHDDKQKEIATRLKEEFQKKTKQIIVTQIVEVKTFYPAEEYHQKYLLKRGLNTC